VTNCSERLGQIAADRAGGPFAKIVTAEDVGYYKPRPETYRAVLAALHADPARVLFVAGSAADVPGARNAGMKVYWHNRIGLKPLDGAARTSPRPRCIVCWSWSDAESAAPRRIDDLETPRLLLDADRLARNCLAMRERCGALGVALRPHLKTAKSVEVARVALALRLPPSRSRRCTRRSISRATAIVTSSAPAPSCRENSPMRRAFSVRPAAISFSLLMR
jgi:hypothetical protein